MTDAEVFAKLAKGISTLSKSAVIHYPLGLAESNPDEWEIKVEIGNRAIRIFCREPVDVFMQYPGQLEGSWGEYEILPVPF